VWSNTQPGRCREKEGGYKEGTRERVDEWAELRLYRKATNVRGTRKRKDVKLGECDESFIIGFRGGALSCVHLKPWPLPLPSSCLPPTTSSPTMFDEDCCLQCGKPMRVDK
jgi:hypothetical protein